MPIIYASGLAALLIAPAVHLLGLRWRWAFVVAVILGGVIG